MEPFRKGGSENQRNSVDLTLFPIGNIPFLLSLKLPTYTLLNKEISTHYEGLTVPLLLFILRLGERGNRGGDKAKDIGYFFLDSFAKYFMKTLALLHQQIHLKT